MRGDDERQFTEFVRETSVGLRRTAYLVCGDWHQAEDAVQNAYVRLYQTWSRVRDPAARHRYVRTTALRWLIDDSRRPRRRERASRTLPDGPAPSVDDAERLDVRAALKQVPPRQRAAIVPRYYEGYDVAETAALLGCSEGTVKSQTARGLTTLRTVLGTDELIDIRTEG
ncbi:SigE family RNA polymerase sigma factor [uncultured Jatrophihabitans sp.]|uniref:SigE family RNA polymerase sigma factor n=1 Tax=uncultured Jatrophihabitans sp. TaxID=1610747 RepID=UPI0035CAD981